MPDGSALGLQDAQRLDRVLAASTGVRGSGFTSYSGSSSIPRPMKASTSWKLRRRSWPWIGNSPPTWPAGCPPGSRRRARLGLGVQAGPLLGGERSRVVVGDDDRPGICSGDVVGLGSGCGVRDEILVEPCNASGATRVADRPVVAKDERLDAERVTILDPGEVGNDPTEGLVALSVRRAVGAEVDASSPPRPGEAISRRHQRSRASTSYPCCSSMVTFSPPAGSGAAA